MSTQILLVAAGLNLDRCAAGHTDLGTLYRVYCGDRSHTPDFSLDCAATMVLRATHERPKGASIISSVTRRNAQTHQHSKACRHRHISRALISHATRTSLYRRVGPPYLQTAATSKSRPWNQGPKPEISTFWATRKGRSDRPYSKKMNKVGSRRPRREGIDETRMGALECAFPTRSPGSRIV